MPDQSDGPREDRSLVSQLLRQWGEGDREALDALIPLVYDELRQLARINLARERPGHTLQVAVLEPPPAKGP